MVFNLFNLTVSYHHLILTWCEPFMDLPKVNIKEIPAAGVDESLARRAVGIGAVLEAGLVEADPDEYTPAIGH